MTTEEVTNLMQSALINNKFDEGVSIYKSYLVGRCHHPYKIRYLDTYVNQYREIEVPCGKCIHCRETRVNSWVQRLYAHSEHYQYVYFVTLTYRSIIEQNPLNDLIIDKLKDAYFMKDAFNKNRQLAYHPTILCKKHYQDFIKRLRKYTNLLYPEQDTELSYFICGEYGAAFGRPHFHLILFSQVPIYKNYIDMAWSFPYVYNLKDETYHYHTSQKRDNPNYVFHRYIYGKTEIQDLKKAGDFVNNNKYKNLLKAPKNSAARCFSYVCKYMIKDTYNHTRPLMLYNSIMPNSFPLKGMELTNKYDKLTDELDLNYQRYLDYRQKPKENFEYLKQILYPIKDYEFEKLPHLWDSFRCTFAPFTESSRSKAIGKFFLLSHLEEYSNGNFTKPKFYTGTLNITPSYFLHKTKQSIFGLKRYSKAIGEKPSFKSLNLEYFRENLFKKNYSALYGELCDFINPNTQVLFKVISDPRRNIIKDEFTGKRYYLTNYFGEPVIQTFIYDKKLRDYRFLQTENFDDFISLQLFRLDKLYHLYNLYRVSADTEEKQRQRLISTITDYEEERKKQDPDYYFTDGLTQSLRKEIYADFVNHMKYRSLSNQKQLQNDL